MQDTGPKYETVRNLEGRHPSLVAVSHKCVGEPIHPHACATVSYRCPADQEQISDVSKRRIGLMSDTRAKRMHTNSPTPDTEVEFGQGNSGAPLKDPLILRGLPAPRFLNCILLACFSELSNEPL